MNAKHIMNLPLKISALTAILLCVLFTACTTETPVPTQEEAEKAVMEKIQAANAAWASENPLGFYENAANDIVWIDDLGTSKRIVGKEALLPYLEGYRGVVPPHKHELFDFHFQYYGDMVIASYFYQGVLEGEKAPPWKAVSIFRYTDGDWSSVLEHWTTVLTEAPAEEAVDASEATESAAE